MQRLRKLPSHRLVDWTDKRSIIRYCEQLPSKNVVIVRLYSVAVHKGTYAVMSAKVAKQRGHTIVWTKDDRSTRARRVRHGTLEQTR